jgi:acyl carrier protein
MHERVAEAHVRRVVADNLGVDVDDLTSDVSLTDDLAVDSLDLLEVALALEGEFGISLPERLLERVRTCGDLVQATLVLARARRVGESRAQEPPPFYRARITSADGSEGRAFDRTGWLTPYAVQELADDALSAGRGARLELAVSAGTDEALGWLRSRFARLGNRGIVVDVRRDARPVPGDEAGERAA